MTAPLLHILHHNHFWLTVHRCIYWEEQEALILSDLHLGKTGHFRKNGIAVPQKVFNEDLQRLGELISHFKPKQIIIVGDMIHSEDNKELQLFVKWRHDFKETKFILVKGNHDILHKEWYSKAAIDIVLHAHYIQGFGFVHDPVDIEAVKDKADYFFSGHLHPGIAIRGLGKQSLQFPCFYFSPKLAILPAYSKFSGLAILKKKKADTVFAIVNQSLVAIK